MPKFINKKVQSPFYEGELVDYQVYGKNHKRYIEYEQEIYSPQQNFLYRRALFGLSVYTKEELETMHFSKKQRIEKVHARTQNVLNLWKQSIVNNMVNTIFKDMFHHSILAKDLVEKFGNQTDPTYISRIDFKSLGLSKKDIINKLLEEKLLPVNFHEL